MIFSLRPDFGILVLAQIGTSLAAYAVPAAAPSGAAALDPAPVGVSYGRFTLV